MLHRLCILSLLLPAFGQPSEPWQLSEIPERAFSEQTRPTSQTKQTNPYLAAQQWYRDQSPETYEATDWIVVYRTQRGKKAAGQARAVSSWLLDRVAGKVAERHASSSLVYLRVTSDEPVLMPKLDARAKAAGVVAVAPNYRRQFTSDPPDDPLFPQQWGLLNDGSNGGTEGADIDVTAAWDTTTGSDEVIVAVLDSGIALDHPDLVPNLWVNTDEIPDNGVDDDNNGYVDDVHGYDFGDMDGSPYDDFGHGTHVAGIIGAVGNNGIGISGVSRKVKVMALRSFLFDFEIIQALNYAADNGARVINASWGGPFPSEALRLAIEEAGERGVLFVAAAGNAPLDLSVFPHYPAGYDLPNVLAVAATDRNDQLAPYSGFSNDIVDIAAPGSAVLSTVLFEENYIEQDFEGLTPPALPVGFAETGPPGAWETFDDNGDQRLRVTFNGTLEEETEFAMEFPALSNPLGPIFLAMRYRSRLPADQPWSIQGYSYRINEWVTLYNLPYVEEPDEPLLYMPRTDRYRFYGKLEPGEHDIMLEFDNLRLYREIVREGESADLEPKYDLKSGTSMAAPHVVGAAALLLSTNPAMSVKEMQMRLLGGGDDLGFPLTTGSRLNAAGALQASGELKIVSKPQTQEVSAGAKVQWSFLNGLDCPAAITLWRNGQQVAVLEEGKTAHEATYTVPNVEPGTGYTLRVTACDSFAESAPFEIIPTAFYQTQDQLMLQYLLTHYDLNEDGRISRVEANRIKSLQLTGVGITRLDNPSFFKYLINLYMAKNSLRELPDLSQLPYLYELDLGYNMLSELPQLPTYLDALILRNNRYTELPDLDYLISLDWLYLDDNQLTQLPALPSGLSMLYLAGNPLGSLPETLPSLSLLHAQGTGLTELPEGVADIKFINVSYNQLTELPLFGEIYNLYCDGNQLTNLGELPTALGMLSFSHNPLEVAPDLSGHEELHSVYGNHANLDQLPQPGGRPAQMHFYGNHFGEDDCGDLQNLIDAELQGFLPSHYNGEIWDGALMAPNANGNAPDCALFPPAEVAVSNMQVDTLQKTLTWRGGGNAARTVDHYEVRIDGEQVGTTRVPLWRLPTTDNVDLNVVPRFTDGSAGTAGELKTTVDPAEVHYIRHTLVEKREGVWQGLALTNPSTEPLKITGTLVDRNGDVPEVAPVEFTLQPGAQIKGLVENLIPASAGMDLFAVEWEAAEVFSALILEGSPEHLNGRQTAPMRKRGTFLIPQVGRTSWFHIRMFSKEQAVVHFTAYDTDGNAILSKDVDVKGILSGDPRTIMGAPYGTTWAIDWWSESDILSEQTVRGDMGFIYETTLDGYEVPSVDGSMTYQRRAFAHGFWREGFVLFHNPNDVPAYVTFDAHTSRGIKIGSEGIELGPRESRWFNPIILFLKLDSPANVQWHATSPILCYREEAQLSTYNRVDNYSSFGMDGQYQDDMMPTMNTRGSRYLVPHAPSNNDWITGVHIVNPEDSDLVMTIRARAIDGSIVETREVTLKARGSMRFFTTELFENAANIASLEILTQGDREFWASANWTSRLTRAARAAVRLQPVE
ncbi:MAG: S8 family serine peptidase [Acidobacteriota bacterium]|nr:S8 family serine peptidase [Acidobacteriota bacterium]